MWHETVLGEGRMSLGALTGRDGTARRGEVRSNSGRASRFKFEEHVVHFYWSTLLILDSELEPRAVISCVRLFLLP